MRGGYRGGGYDLAEGGVRSCMEGEKRASQLIKRFLNGGGAPGKRKFLKIDLELRMSGKGTPLLRGSPRRSMEAVSQSGR